MSIAFLDQKCKADTQNMQENSRMKDRVGGEAAQYMPYSSRIGHFLILILCLAFSLSVGLYKLKIMGISRVSEVLNQAVAADGVENIQPKSNTPERAGQGNINPSVHIIDHGETWQYQP